MQAIDRIHEADVFCCPTLPLAQAWHASSNLAILPVPRQLRAGASRRWQLLQHAGGGCIYAANEAALQVARTTLLRLHQDQIRFDAPQARTYVDAVRGPMAPLMFVRVDTCRHDLDRLVGGLRERQARLHEVELRRSDAAVIRAQARLADMLGFDEHARRLARLPVRVWSWLGRYQPVVRGAGG